MTRGQVEDYWGGYRSSQRIFNSIDNCWDLCDEFDEGTAGQIEDDPNDSEDDIFSQPQSQQAPTPFSSEIGRSEDASNFYSMLVDPCGIQAPTLVSVSLPAQVAALPHDIPHPDPRDMSDCASMLVDPPRDTEALASESVSSTPAQVAALPHDLPHPNPQDTSGCPSILVDPPHNAEAPAPVSVSLPAQVPVLSHDLSHPNTEEVSDCPSMPLNPCDVEAWTPVSVSSPAQVATLSHNLSYPNT